MRISNGLMVAPPSGDIKKDTVVDAKRLPALCGNFSLLRWRKKMIFWQFKLLIICHDFFSWCDCEWIISPLWCQTGSNVTSHFKNLLEFHQRRRFCTSIKIMFLTYLSKSDAFEQSLLFISINRASIFERDVRWIEYAVFPI